MAIYSVLCNVLNKKFKNIGNYAILRFALSIFILYMVIDKINTDKKIQASQISYFKLMDKFSTDETFIEYFIKLRYPNGVTCNKCGSDKIYN